MPKIAIIYASGSGKTKKMAEAIAGGAKSIPEVEVLLKNAVQALDKGGRIIVRAYCNENEAVIIDVSDDGPVIPEEVAQHIFVPFFTTKKEGSGIGLSISKQIMRLSGGTLMLNRDMKQGMTTFSMVFN